MALRESLISLLKSLYLR